MNIRISCIIVIVLSSHNKSTVSERILLLAKADENAKLLMTIPGIGCYSALLIISEIGEINRFPDSYHLCSYAEDLSHLFLLFTVFLYIGSLLICTRFPLIILLSQHYIW